LKIARELGNEMLMSNLLYEALLIAIRMKNVEGFNELTKQVDHLSANNHLSESHYLSLLIMRESGYLQNKGEDTYKNYLDKLIKIFNYENNKSLKLHVYLKQAIVSILEGDLSEAAGTITEHVTSDDHEKRLYSLGKMLLTEIALLNGDDSRKDFEEIDRSVIRKIPTLLPKYNCIEKIVKGKFVTAKDLPALANEIGDVKQVFLAEEFPFCLKAVPDDNLSLDSSQIKGLLDKFHGHAKLTGFLAGRKIPG